MTAPGPRDAAGSTLHAAGRSSELEVSVIVPTYREADNLKLLVPRIADALDEAALEGEILIIDDDSPDQTVRVCSELAQQYPVRCIVRRGARGLASAVLDGIAQSSSPLVVVLDADLSHPPEKIPDLVAALAEDTVDFVIGSRYVAEGTTEEGWGLLRLLNSQVAALLARPLIAVRDPMAGFFAVRRKTVADAAPLDPVGFKIALELMVKCQCRCIREVPISFAKRVHGRSKLGLREQVNYLRHLLRLYRFKIGSWRSSRRLA